MKKITLSLISDVLFFTLCAFCLSFIAVRYFFSVTAAICAAVTLATIAGTLATFLLIKRREKVIESAVCDKDKKRLAVHLSTLPQDLLYGLFLKALNGRKEGERIISNGNEYLLAFKPTPLNCDDIAACIKLKSSAHTTLLCCAVSDDGKDFASQLKLEIITISKIYDILKDSKLLPQSYPFELNKKQGFFKRIKGKLNRKKCPTLFLSGVVLAVYSYFSFYPAIYLFFGCGLIALAAICLFINAKNN